MCFSVPRKNSRIKIAKSDIVVFKVGFPTQRGDKQIFISLIHEFMYEIDYLNPVVNLVIKRKLFSNVISEGYHSFEENPGCNGKFIIPKGAQYMFNRKDGVYVSSQLIYKGKSYAGPTRRSG